MEYCYYFTYGTEKKNAIRDVLLWLHFKNITEEMEGDNT
jgi:hypothetical protein